MSRQSKGNDVSIEVIIKLKMMLKIYFAIAMLFLNGIVYATSNFSLAIKDIPQFKKYSPAVKTLITQANTLMKMNLAYLYGSNDPRNKGMDCSGTIYYLLQNLRVSDVPRQANEIYTWVAQKGKLFKVKHQKFNSSEFKQLKPGDLLFWTGTYAIKRFPPITHVMLYLGLNSKHMPIMFGASDGTYQRKKMWGVSVFDFKLSNHSTGKFVAYGCIPHLTC